jgi:hypothetical protein
MLQESLSSCKERKPAANWRRESASDWERGFGSRLRLVSQTCGADTRNRSHRFEEILVGAVKAAPLGPVAPIGAPGVYTVSLRAQGFPRAADQ